LVTEGHAGARSLGDRWATAAGAPEYRGAFSKVLADPERGHLLWNEAEAEAYRQVAGVQSELEVHNMSTTGSAGGYMIPLTLDPAIMLTNDGSNNPLRRSPPSSRRSRILGRA
jgi:predicted phage gp36 major capsid-like protein